MENFCYWHENSPTGNSENYFKYMGKICLLRMEEYKIENENEIKNKTSIFCPYKNCEEAKICLDYKVMERLNEQYSK